MQATTKISPQKNTKLRRISRSCLNLSKKARFKQSNSNLSQNLLKTANKYIFVHDFEKAGLILKQLSKKYFNDYEVLFRRVEVASKRDGLSELLIDLQKLAQKHPESKAIEFASILTKIRIASKYDFDKDKKTDFKKSFFPQHKEITYSPNIKMPLIHVLSNKKVRINRALDIPDDYYPEDFANSENFDQLNKTSSEKEEIYNKALELQANYPDNYAAWYVAGCALESIGRIQEALELWTQSYKLNNSSIATLATLTELQQLGVVTDFGANYSEKFESLDKYLVHGHLETHTQLYNEFIKAGDYKNAIQSLKILAEWLQRQYGEVPVEIEVLNLLGSMHAYKLANNLEAAEASRAEVENIVIACKKSPRDMNQLYFIAQLCEDYGLKSLARMCYFTVLISSESHLDLIIQTASHCVSNNPSEGLLECLKVSYKNTHGSPEIRFCMLICGLKIAHVNISEYMVKKNQVRDLILKEPNSKNILSILEELNKIYNSDPEVHYYLGEIHSKIGHYKEAKEYFTSMFARDYYNTDGILRYIFFLLKTRDYVTARKIAQEGLQLSSLSEQQANEMHWSIAATYFSEGNFENSYNEILKSISSDPWNPSYLILLLRSSINIDNNNFLKDNEELIKNLEDIILNSETPDSDKDALAEKTIKYGNDCIENNQLEYAWVLSKCVILITNNISEQLLQFIAKSGAGYNSRIAVQELLLLLKNKNINKGLNFATLSACIAKIYSLSGNWPLVDEWLSIAKNNKDSAAKLTKQKLFELEALSMTMRGTDLKKAQLLLEAAIDSYDNVQKVPLDTKVLHGYLLVAQGQFSVGLEKMQNNISTNASIQSLYFLIKGLERAGQLNNTTKESLTQLFKIYPTNSFEQKMVEEIFITVGNKSDTNPVGLAC